MKKCIKQQTFEVVWQKIRWRCTSLITTMLIVYKKQNFLASWHKVKTSYLARTTHARPRRFCLKQWFSKCGTRTTSGTRTAFLSYSKSFVNSFLCYANVANSFICYINLKYILSKLHSSETRGVHSKIKKTSGGTRSQKVWEPLV